MTTPPTGPQEGRATDPGGWAGPVRDLGERELPPGADSLNVAGRRPAAVHSGFGQEWRKTYRLRFPSDTPSPREVIASWKEHFDEFWPEGNHFWRPRRGITPGEVGVAELSMPAGVKVATGLYVLYADDESFTLETAQGHMFAGWITFSATTEDGRTVAQAQTTMRASDPLYEAGLMLGGHATEDRFWEQTLNALARHFGAEGAVEHSTVLLQTGRHWGNAANIWYNASVRTTLHRLLTPVRFAWRELSRPPGKPKAGPR